MSTTDEVDTSEPASRRPGGCLQPQGVVDLRGKTGAPAVLAYPDDAVVIISGLPGSGKSTLMERWSEAAPAVDPRVVHLECEAVMPAWLPYGIYRPWARLRHFQRLRRRIRRVSPLLVHDCGSRPWMRRWLARHTREQRRELHVVLLDVGADGALAGQRTRGRWVRPRVFARHQRGLDRLLGALAGAAATSPGGVVSPVPESVAETASVVLLDRISREHVAAVTFGLSS